MFFNCYHVYSSAQGTVYRGFSRRRAEARYERAARDSDAEVTLFCSGHPERVRPAFQSVAATDGALGRPAAVAF